MDEKLKNFIKINDECSLSEGSFAFDFFKIRITQDEFRDQDAYSCFAGKSNSMKNRYRDILPYDRTLVRLKVADEVDGRISTENEMEPYINANFINGANGSVGYIAAQGPVPSTVDTFWRMILEYKIEQIIMLCNLVENNRTKCEQYWPKKTGEQMYCTDAIITLLREELLSEFTIRHLNVEWNDENGKAANRLVLHYHYVKWPDHGCPDSVSPLLRMLAMIRESPSSSECILVHCSAGCGRTGTIIAIDIAFNHLQSQTLPLDFNVYDLVLELRKQRASMVQSVDQYHFLHVALVALFKQHLEAHKSLDIQSESELCGFAPLIENEEDSLQNPQNDRNSPRINDIHVLKTPETII